MKKHFLKAFRWAFLSCLIGVATSCTEEATSYPEVDGQDPVITLVADKIETAAGNRITIEGTLTDADGIVSVNLKCTDLYLNKTIDLVELYGEPQTSYELKYYYDLAVNELGELFKVDITVTDVGGRTVTHTVEISMNADFENPVFTVAPGNNLIVLLPKDTSTNPSYTLNCSVTDDQGLDYVSITIPGIDGYEEGKRFSAEGGLEFDVSDKIEFPNRNQTTYNLTLKVVDLKGKETTTTSAINVSEMQDFTKMYLADVATVAELNSDIFGVPMVINHTGSFIYEARYYNKTSNTEIYFIPQKEDFNPICFGLDPEDNTKLTYDPAVAQPIILEEAGVYYKININIDDLTYSMTTYTVEEATDPINYVYGSKTFDLWENGTEYVEFYIGWGDGPAGAGQHLFVQDKNNPHLFYYPADGATWTQNAGDMNFIISNYHREGWWDHVEWRCNDSYNIEKFGYYSKKNDVNPNWEGTNMKWSDGTDVQDNWMKPTIKVGGNYRFEFDAHLGRGKIVPAN